VTDPLRGASRAHPLGGRAATVVSSCADIGCRVSVNKSMDSGCQSGFRRNHQKSKSAILQQFCGIPLAEKRDVVVKKNMSHLVWSSGVRCADVVGASRGAVRVIGNLLVSGRALCMSVSECEQHVRRACRGPDSLVVRDLSRPQCGEAPCCVFKKKLESILEVGTRR
jgi:hypothetical protein